MHQPDRKQLQDFWHERVKRCEKRPGGTIEAFCKAEGVSAAALGYWQKKFSSPKKTLKTPTRSFQPFAKVDVVGPFTDPSVIVGREMTAHIDPKWAADFVYHLFTRQSLGSRS